MIARPWMLLVGALLGSPALGACASTAPPPPKVHAAHKDAAVTQHGHHAEMAKPAVVARPSEQEAVVEDVPDPAAQAVFEKRLAAPAVPLDAKAPRATELALDDTARGAAADMTPLAEVAGASLTEGQRAMMPVSLAPGECVTFIAEGGLGVIEVDLFLLLADRSSGIRVLAEDPGVGPIGIVGGHGHCFENPRNAPLAAELHVTVRRGAGVVLLRGYKKK